ncbi:MAG: hypothetical protein JW820_09695 [Spirochaetales bacterium]|nr:hypothetical protein [Spirochaetales bacterium]
MTRRVNYEDNIFFLNLILKQISAAFKLNIDAAVFKDRIVEEIRFLDAASEDVFQGLQGNSLMIDRWEHLKELQKLNRAFISLMEEILAGGHPLAQALEDSFPLIERLLEARRAQLDRIRQLTAGYQSAQGEAEQTISETEYRFLLSPESEETAET